MRCATSSPDFDVAARAIPAQKLDLVRTLRASIIAVLATISSALVLVQVTSLASVLHLSPLHADDWAIAGLGGLVVGSLAAFLPSSRAQNVYQREIPASGHQREGDRP
jgi:hypothetical protein